TVHAHSGTRCGHDGVLCDRPGVGERNGRLLRRVPRTHAESDGTGSALGEGTLGAQRADGRHRELAASSVDNRRDHVVIMPLAFEARWGDALLDAMIPEPGNGLPPMARVDRRTFWARFAHAAPWPLRLGLRAATYVIGGLAPFLLGHRHIFVR